MQTLGMRTATANSSMEMSSSVLIVKVRKRIGSTTSEAKISNTSVTPAVSTANSKELDK